MNGYHSLLPIHRLWEKEPTLILFSAFFLEFLTWGGFALFYSGFNFYTFQCSFLVCSIRRPQILEAFFVIQLLSHLRQYIVVITEDIETFPITRKSRFSNAVARNRRSMTNVKKILNFTTECSRSN